MKKLLPLALLFTGLAAAQTIPTPLLVSRVNNITSAAQVQDNRSQAARYCDYHSFLASGTGTWSVTMEYSDSSANGPWSSFGSAAVITNADNPAIGYGFGFHPFIRFNTTVGSTAVNYTCQSSLYIPPGGNGGGGVTFPITIQEGGTSATTATGATVNLEYIAPYTGAVAESDATALNRQVSVWEFGTPGTTSDWTTAFQNAINVYTQRGGVQVYIPCGTYNFANSLSVTHQPVSIVGESEHCVVLNYTGTGTFLSVVDTPPTGGPHGEYRNFTIATPNATSSTIAMEVATSHGSFENLQVTGCSSGTAWQIDNGLVNSGNSPWYGEFNSWINTSDDHCRIGYHFTPSGGSPPDPTQSFMNYNDFSNVSGLASSGQTVFQVDPGFYFSYNTLDLSCKIDNSSTISSTLPSVCIKTSGNWFQNTTYLNGEWNSTVGTSTGPPYSVQILSGGKFANMGGSIGVFAIPGNGGAQVPVDNEAGNGSGTPFVTVHQQYQPDWDTGTYTLGSTSTTPWTGFRDQGTGSLGVLEGTSVNSPFVTMNSTAGNKFIVGKVTPGSVFGTMTDIADVDTSGNLTLKGTNINVNGLSWTWPSSHSSGCLNDNGSGTISIVSCSGGGGSGLLAPGTNNVLLQYTSGLNTTPATASNVLTTLSSALGAPNGLATLDSSALLPLTQVPPSVVQSTNSYANPSWITTIDSGKLFNAIPSALIPASSSGNFGGVKDTACSSGQHIFSVVSGIITCTADSGGGGGGTPAISSLLGATAANTISNGDNAQVWNWTIGTTNKTGLAISESAPSTAAGTPILFRSSTLSTSTAYPVYFSAQGTANGVYMPPTGVLQKIPGGSGGIDAGSLLNTVPIGTLPIIGLQTFAEAGGCANGIPYSVFDLPSSAYPTPNCYGTSYPFGALDFLDAANSYSYLRMVVPSGIQTEDVDVYWFSGSATQTVNFTVATSCIPAGSGVISPTFNPVQTLASTSGSANTLTVVTRTGVTLTGCAANDEEILQIGRDVSDSSTTTASLRGVRITVHENVSQ